jgi:phosphatidate cytidylyltransferase
MSESPKLSSHQKRWLTGVFIGMPVLACIAFGPSWGWYILVSAVAAVGLWELHGLFFPVTLCSKWTVFSFAAGLYIPFAAYHWGSAGLSLALVACLFAAFSLTVLSAPLNSEEISRIAVLALCWLYVPYMLSFVLLVGAAPQGRFWILFVLAVIVAGDAGAYYSGRRMGRHKLHEIVSPKKTVEGAVGGLISSVVAGSILGLIFLRHVPLIKLLLFGLLIAITGQVGDLIESMIKRNSGKKDSSALLPGHGGILDRLDSHLFAFPVMWALLKWAALD